MANTCKQGKSHLFLVLGYSWLWWTTCNVVAARTQILKPGDTLNSITKLCSESSKYFMKFSETGSGAGAYLFINQPVDADSVVLSLDLSGQLKIESNNTKTIILYSSPPPSNNIVATSLDIGNFLLQHHRSDETESVLWKSFDYPTYTLLPGMMLGVNFKTGPN
ncbi:G-type lectin S-receptor-like serine/threonine-protein kinase CES101 [Glycine soja]|uniref:G-type lectin S-receptor-like serine/threonine-protein kinase CES101 n=1 Tax=Glycine soja TaxID=3848 RepID=A0A445GWE7_GLYSO|nr:G-type lectin S-receptor-like serine/threonine-protein kinase CES101 [Glycine soja]